MSYVTATGPIGAEGRYFDALIEGRLELPRCEGCGLWHWPAVWRCGECGSSAQTWHQRELKGSVFTYTRTHHPFGGTEGLTIPFTTLLVSIDDTTIRLVGVLEGPEEGLRIGALVAGRIDRTTFGTAEIPSLRWRLA